MAREDEARSGRCAIVGRPNVGKSTLLNALLGQKLAIATERPGTTRCSILGVYVAHNESTQGESTQSASTQIAFVDTPGMHRPRSALGRVLVEQAETALADADCVLAMIEAPKKVGPPPRQGVDERDLKALDWAVAAGKPTIIAVNKVDQLPSKDRLLPIIDFLHSRYADAPVVPISATRRIQLDALIQEIRNTLPAGLLYDENVLTDRPERFFVAELIREAAIRQTRQEVPYGTAVAIDRFEDDGRMAHIDATLIVEKPSHKGIVIGVQGARIKSIGTDARKEIEPFLERKVMLKLWVRVQTDWTRTPREARRLVLEPHE